MMMKRHTLPNIFRTLRGRFRAVRITIILLPLLCCVLFTAGLSFLLMDRYAENFEALGGREFPAAKILGAQLPLLLSAGAVFMVFLMALIFASSALFRRRLTKMLSAPLEALFLGMEKLRDSQKGCRLDTPKGPFGPLYGAFNEAAAALEGGGEEEAAPDPRQPLGRLREGLDDIRRALDTTPAAQRQGLAPAEEKLRRLGRLLDEVLLFLALEKGEFPMIRDSLELGCFVGALTAELGEEYRRQGLALLVAEDREPLWICADGPWLREALVRLIGYYRSRPRLEHGRVLFRCRRRRKKGPGDAPALAELLVTGNGLALGEEDLSVLFERPGFFRTPGAFPPGESFREDGLSLALAARIIKNLGGGIYAEKSSLGGTAVLLCFPLGEENTGFSSDFLLS